MTAEMYPDPGTVAPADGGELDAVAATPIDDVEEIVDASRRAAVGWAERSLHERAAVVEAFAEAVLRRRHDVADIVSLETGKSSREVLLVEVSSIGNYADGAIEVAERALASRKVPLSPLEYPGKSAVIEAVPRGVVGIIAPWNYPVANFFKPFFPAILAGNGVVLKPSEYTPRSGAIFAEIAADVFPSGLVGIVQGGGEVGAALLEGGVDAATFTGSVATGRKVAARAGELLIPCSVELGGKDAAIVLEDCDLDRTAMGIAQWALHNCGQNCAAIERVYVVDAIADRFVSKLGEIAAGLHVAPTKDADLGPLQSEQQRAIVEAHVEDALEKGAELVTGGERTGEGLGYRPTVLDKCTEEMDVATKETFGPVVAVMRVSDADEAVRRANASKYGLNGSVWTKDIRRGRQLARQLDVGIANVNNHAFTGSMPHVPWTGVKETGTGVAASEFAYHTFVRRRTLFVDKSSKPDPWWMPLDASADDLADAVAQRALGSFTAFFKMAGAAGKRMKAVARYMKDPSSRS